MKLKSLMLRIAGSAVFAGAVMLSGILPFSCTPVLASSEDGIGSVEEYVLRPSEAGSLHVDQMSLRGEDGREVVLQGASLHGLTWYPEYVNQELFDYVSEDWNTNLVRLPVYSDIYSDGEQKESLKLLEEGVAYAANADMYALVDWHILDDNDPNENLASAIEFFKTVSTEYADSDNVLYEICNEPNGDTTWEDVREYASIVIPVIRQNDPDAVIIVGTPDYDRDLASPVSDPLDFDNIMYTFHFYTASHRQEMMDKLTTALDAGLPVFISECGISEASGDGEVDYGEAREWFSLLHEKHLSYAVWSLSNKDESSAMIRYTCSRTGKLSEKNLTETGLWIRALFRGEDVNAVAQPILRKQSFYQQLKTNKGLAWTTFALITLGILLLVALLTGVIEKISHRKRFTYDELIRRTGGCDDDEANSLQNYKRKRRKFIGTIALLFSTFTTFLYLIWRAVCSVPLAYGWIAILCNLILLAVEILGFAESLVHYYGMIHLRNHPLPKIGPDEYPDVDIFIATYSEPPSLLRKTIIGCKHMEYPDRNKVHIYLCDDKRRPEMRALAAELGVHYFDRPDNEGAKAGNLNHAMGLTDSPYIVTFDADMIPRREFLLRTIPYFVDARKRNANLPEGERMPLGLVQTPQCFYNPDIFQHNLYNERHIPNEQDFFYRTIESAKTYSNSVIYGGSNTVISRKALEDIGGFYTKTITEDFATGMLIESNGYISLGLSEPLASGLAPTSFREHVQQRTRWGRGVLSTGRQLKFMSNKKLTIEQKLSYWSSVVYWYSPVKNMIYLLSPMVYALFGIPVFKCDLTDILIFWLPMFAFQSITLRVMSTRTMSSKWSGIQEMVVMPYLFMPIIKESLGITLSTFKVTNKNGGVGSRKTDYRMLMPFIVLIIMSVLAIIGRGAQLIADREFGLLVILFWLVRNLYFLIMGLFLVDGRDSDGENVHVYDAEPVMIDGTYSGITTHLTEHNMSIFLDDADALKLGDLASVHISSLNYEITVKGIVTHVRKARKDEVPDIYTIEITDYCDEKDEYVQMLYDRIPTLPQQYHKELGLLPDLLRNLGERGSQYFSRL